MFSNIPEIESGSGPNPQRLGLTDSRNLRRPRTVCEARPQGFGDAAIRPLTIIEIDGAPYGNRTRVFAVRGRRPGPLDEGSVKRAAERASISAARSERKPTTAACSGASGERRSPAAREGNHPPRNARIIPDSRKSSRSGAGPCARAARRRDRTPTPRQCASSQLPAARASTCSGAVSFSAGSGASTITFSTSLIDAST